MTITSQEPAIGDLVAVRGQRWVVSDVDASGSSTLVTLQSVEDGRYNETLDVIWEIEPGRRIKVRGRVGEHHGELAIYNPWYELQPSG